MLAGQFPHERRHPLGHGGQVPLDIGPVREAMQALGPGPQLPRSLRAAQEQHRDQRGLRVGQVQSAGQRLVVLARAPPAIRPDDAHELGVAQLPALVLEGLLVQVHHRLTTRRLVAGGPQRVERQRIAGRHGDLLLHQAAEDPLLHGIEDGEVSHAPTLGTVPCAGMRSDTPQRTRRQDQRLATWIRTRCPSDSVVSATPSPTARSSRL